MPSPEEKVDHVKAALMRIETALYRDLGEPAMQPELEMASIHAQLAMAEELRGIREAMGGALESQPEHGETVVMTVHLNQFEADRLPEFVAALERGEVPDTTDDDMVVAALKAAVEGSEGTLQPARRQRQEGEGALRKLWKAATEHWHETDPETEEPIPLNELLFDSSLALPGMSINGKELYDIGVELGLIEEVDRDG